MQGALPAGPSQAGAEAPLESTSGERLPDGKPTSLAIDGLLYII